MFFKRLQKQRSNSHPQNSESTLKSIISFVSILLLDYSVSMYRLQPQLLYSSQVTYFRLMI
jgi:hypothetical protein